MTSPFPDFEQPAPQPRYPQVAGHKRRETSKAAAVAATPRVGHLRDRVLAEIKKSPATADEIAERIGETVLSTRPRTSELARLGKICDAGIRRSNVSGRSAIVWRSI